MGVPNDNADRKRVRGRWADPPRSGMRRILAPWEYRRLRFWAGVRARAGVVLVGLGAVTLAFGGNDWATYGWTLFFLALAVAQFSFAYWELTTARSESA